MKKLVAALVVASLLFLSIVAAVKGEPDIPFGDEVQTTMPGSTITAAGTNFESGNIVLDSSEPVKLVLESVPDMVTIQIEYVSGAASSEMTLSGFAPLTTYHKYEDNYHNHVAFTTDTNGKYSYTQDISKPHFVFIQTRPSTKFISDNPTGGDCASIGIWNPATKTCTLTTDLNETIQIDGNNITLDGNGHTLTGAGTGYGVYLYGKSGVTIKNLTARQFSSGIYLWLANNNAVTDSTASFNALYGISFSNSNNNILTRNTANSNNYTAPYEAYAGINIGGSNNILMHNTANFNALYGIKLSGSNNTLFNNSMNGNRYNFYSSIANFIDTSNLVDGKPIYYVNGAINQIYDSSTNAGTFYCINCNNVTIRGLTVSRNGYGIFLWNTNNSLLENINASDNRLYGIYLQDSNDNTLRNNTASSNGPVGAFLLTVSSNNTVINNSADSNRGYGFIIVGIPSSPSHDNKFVGNTANSNSVGVHIKNTDNNIIANNTIILNGHGLISAHSNNNIITDNIANLNRFSGFSFYNDTNGILVGNTANSNNQSGIGISSSKNNVLSNNILSLNKYNGINIYSPVDIDFPDLLNSSDNIVIGNTINSNGRYGIIIGYSDTFGIGYSFDNKVYNNKFINNTMQAYVYGDSGSGDNIFNLPAPIGGNYWSDYDTPAEGCDDLNGDNFCDVPYVFGGGQDNLPWTKQDGWLDGIPPTTSDNAPSDWQNADFSVLFTCTDNPGGSGCKETKYAIDDGAWQTGNSVSISVEGDHQISYYSIDNMGNQESVKSTHAKLDKTPPITEAVFSGNLVGTCYNSDVNVTLNAADALSGVVATSYSLDGAEWMSYTGMFAVTDEGTHLLRYLSSDKANNYETEKSANFKIDRTPPEAIIRFDTASKDIKVYNSESGEEAGYVVLPSKKHDERDEEKGWTLRQYKLTDCANNSLVLLFMHKKEGNEAKAKIISLQYNGGEVIDVTKNQIGAEYSKAKDGSSLKELEQKIEVKNAFIVTAKYSAKNNETEIKTKLEGQKKEQRETKPGLVVLELLTAKGGLAFRH